MISAVNKLEITEGRLPVPAAPQVLLSVRGASKKFCRTLTRSLRYMTRDILFEAVAVRADASLRPDEFWALRNISCELRRGESLGVMGLNGAGKSTLLKLILGSLRLTEGEISVFGRTSLLSEHGLGFDPLLTGRENVYLAAAVLEIERRRVARVFNEIVSFAGLEPSIDSPLRGYSAGMRARLGFSVAIHLEPEILLVDEVLTVGDIGFQRRCIKHARQYLQRGGSLILVSHNPHLVQLLCDRCIVLEHGAVTWDGDAIGGVGQYLRAAQVAPDDPLALDAAISAAPPVAPEIAEDAIRISGYNIQPVAAPALRTGEPARICLGYVARRSLSIRWGFSLLSSDLATAIASDGLMEPFSVATGEGELEAIIPRLPLAAGRYALRVAVLDPHTEMPYALGGFDSAPHYFTVEAPISRRNNYRMYTRDLVVLEDVRWHGPEIKRD